MRLLNGILTCKHFYCPSPLQAFNVELLTENDCLGRGGGRGGGWEGENKNLVIMPTVSIRIKDKKNMLAIKHKPLSGISIGKASFTAMPDYMSRQKFVFQVAPNIPRLCS